MKTRSRQKRCTKNPTTRKGIVVGSIATAVAVFFMTPLDEILIWVPLATIIGGTAFEMSIVQTLGLFFGLLAITSAIFYIVLTTKSDKS